MPVFFLAQNWPSQLKQMIEQNRNTVKKCICIFLFCFVALTSKCQFVDSLQSVIQKKGTFTFGFDSRNSYINNNYANIFGFNIGICFEKKFTIGGGYNALSSPIYNIQTIKGELVKTELGVNYFSYYAAYTIYLTNHWQLDIPISIGIGEYSLYNSSITENSNVIMPLEPQVEVTYNFNKYWGLSTEVGYRMMLINNDLLQYNFNSITYSVGLDISPFEIYAHFFPDTKWAKMIEASN